MKIFTLGNEKIHLSDEFEFYHKYACKFTQMAYTYKKNLKDCIKKNCNNIEDYVNNVPVYAEHFIDEAISECIDLLIENDIYDYDFRKLKDEYEEELSYEDTYEYSSLLEEYNAICQDEQDNTDRKNINRSSRSHWQGGGFGIGGAIKGALQAGMLNIATDAVRGIGDSISDSQDRKRYVKLKEQLNTGNLADDLSEGIWDIIYYELSSAFGEIMEDHEKCDAGSILWENDGEASSIYNNLDRIRNKDKRGELLVKILNLNPYKYQYIDYLYYNGIELDYSSEEIYDFIEYIDPLHFELVKLLDFRDKFKEITETYDNLIDIANADLDELDSLILSSGLFNNYYRIIANNPDVVECLENIIEIIIVCRISKYIYLAKNTDFDYSQISLNDLFDIEKGITENLKKYGFWNEEKKECLCSETIEILPCARVNEILYGIRAQVDKYKNDEEEKVSKFLHLIADLSEQLANANSYNERFAIIQKIDEGIVQSGCLDSNLFCTINDTEQRKLIQACLPRICILYITVDINRLIGNLNYISNASVKNIYEAYNCIIYNLDKFHLLVSKDPLVISDDIDNTAKEQIMIYVDKVCQEIERRNNEHVIDDQDNAKFETLVENDKIKEDNSADSENILIEECAVATEHRYCTNCGAEISESDRFCTQCGCALITDDKYKFCTQCGTKCSIDSLYCTNCGYPLEQY